MTDDRSSARHHRMAWLLSRRGCRTGLPPRQKMLTLRTGSDLEPPAPRAALADSIQQLRRFFDFFENKIEPVRVCRMTFWRNWPASTWRICLFGWCNMYGPSSSRRQCTPRTLRPPDADSIFFYSIHLFRWGCSNRDITDAPT
jgi:hypothetical protein